ncbi:polyprenol phosphomannose-dependent alpha 1,6 mannosyltransferase MptB [Sphaerisporangium album]|uniref:polyprenol phosphomannose-dependent alpha 1,6 mannosyltransferase MptB n=1 Tax=Sphaerisporangium album TaxID=509200 RepID=UPI001FEA71B3|nr:polyprenol phosphomannose-dependent alpha 1,6 mannosyltransferase MptB [Sphaerisporangium album]
MDWGVGRGWWARVAVAGGVLSVVVTVAIGALGPSVVVPRLPGPAWQPPYSLDARPDGHLVVGLEAAAVLLGALGLAAGLLALRRGWRPDPRLLLLAGCLAAVVLAFLPPSGSADHLNYAAYGRMVALGHDPYATGAVDLPGDPIADSVELPWREEPSVYGPVATAVQALASLVGGDSVRLTVFVLALFNAAAFVTTALLLHRHTRNDPARQARAALLWTANPLLIYQLLAGMHVDTLAVVFVVGALTIGGLGSRPPSTPPLLDETSSRLRAVGGRAGSRWVSGALLGLGIAVKANAGLVALGPAWLLRGSPKRLAIVAGSATVTVLVAYVLAGRHSLDQVLHASKSLSLATPWRLLQYGLQAVVGKGSAYRGWIQAGSLLLLAILAVTLSRVLLSRGLPISGTSPRGASSPETSSGVWASVVGPWGEREEAARVAVAVVAAWLVATPYALPWYDGLGFALLAMITATPLDGFMTARLAVLSLAYVPARQKLLPDDLQWLVTVWRGQVVPWLLLTLTAALVWWAVRAARRARTPRA